MTFKTHAEIARGRIDPAPMVDIVFLLLIFLMLSSPFVLQPGFGLVEMPRTAGATSASLQGLVVTISRDNLLFFNAQPTTLAKLPEQLRQAVREARNPELVLKADRQVGYENIVKIISLALDAGVSAVNLATRPETPVVAPQ